MAVFSTKDQRRRLRVRLSCLVRMRLSLPMVHDFDEVLATENACRDGFYAPTIPACYKTRMRVLVTFPDSTAPGAINRGSAGEVARGEDLPDGRNGIAVRLLTASSFSIYYDVATIPGGSSHVSWRIADKEATRSAGLLQHPASRIKHTSSAAWRALEGNT